MRVLVTGAAGCIGRTVCAALSGAGYEVRGLARTRAPQGECWRGVEWRHGDLKEMRLNALVDGVDAIVHLAALVHKPRLRAEAPYRRDNVEVTERLLTAARAANLPSERFIFSSSAAIHCIDGAVNRDETAPLAPGDAYARSKLAGETMVRGAGGVVLRFPVVYGAGDRGNIARMARAIRGGWFVMPSGRLGRRSMLAAGNAAASVRLVLEARQPGGHTWVVTDRDAVRVDYLAALLAECLGVKPPYRVPCALCSIAAAVGERTRMAPLAKTRLRKLTTDLTFSSAAIRTELGYRDTTNLAHGIAELVAALD